MSGSLIRQRLSMVETDLRDELRVMHPQWADLSLGDIIEALITAELCHLPIYSRLSRLDAAFCQLDIGLYGLCADCEMEIEPARLQQDPTEQRCQRCAAEYQQEHRQELRLSH